MPAFRKVAADEAIQEELRCSFCGREPADGSDLIAVGETCICDECLANCAELMASDDRERSGDADADDEPGAANGDADDGAGGSTGPRPTRAFFRLLTDEDVAALASMTDLIDAMDRALRRFSAGDLEEPMRAGLSLGHDGECLDVMTARVRDPDAVGAKLVTVFNRNRSLGLPTHLATMLLFSPETGALLAVLGGRYLTEAGTAAVSAVSARLLARDDASVVAIIGSGAQARSHLVALDCIFEMSQVRVWSPTVDHQSAFIDEMRSSTTARLVGCDSAEQAVLAADVVVLATSASEPVVRSEWIKAGAHVISVGACRPGDREMDPALVQRSRLFVDSRAAALAESGDIVLGIRDRLFTAAHIVGELGEVLEGKVEGRRSPKDVTIFKSLGLAVEDVVAAELVYRRAVTKEAGQELEL